MKNSIVRSVAVVLCGCIILAVGARPSHAVEDKKPLIYETMPNLALRLQGPMGQRIDNNAANWVVRLPKANPKMVTVTDIREREPKTSLFPPYVPWQCEYIGKYLTNAVLALRFSDDPELHNTVRVVMEELIARQDEDGYLGPYPKQERLLVCWDLWGHYHAITALLSWHERTGEQAALDCAIRAADFICRTFMDAGKRIKEMPPPETNFAISTSLCQLYRLTGNERYLAQTLEEVEDWESSMDFFRCGLNGTEYYRLPSPRWECIHGILTLPELYRLTGDERYLTAFMNLWNSVYKLEMHNNGSFTSFEAAIGNPYDPQQIETCCTIAWMAMSVEALRVTGRPECADVLESATYNAAAALQHPSGSWSTYNTPMDGRRSSSTETLADQGGPGQPELSCCTVNAPRGICMVSDWGVMKSRDAAGKAEAIVNYYGPGTMAFDLDGNEVVLTQTTEYPRDGKIAVAVSPKKTAAFTVKFRVPGWAEGARITEPGQNGSKPLRAGEYHCVRRTWKKGDVVRLDFPMTLRYISGDLDAAGKISVYRGPLLLAYDQRFNAFESDAIPVLTPAKLKSAAIVIPPRNPRKEVFGEYAPWLLATLPGEGNTPPLVLCDFASAGSLGTTYASWLAAHEIVPPIPACDAPGPGTRVAPGVIPFSWRRLTDPDDYEYQIVVADTPDFSNEILRTKAGRDEQKRILLPADQTSRFVPGKEYFWKLILTNAFGSTESQDPPRNFSVDASLPSSKVEDFAPARIGVGPELVVVSDDLAGQPAPTVGELGTVSGTSPAEGPDGKPDTAVRLDGKAGKIVYTFPWFPAEDFTFTLDFLVEEYIPAGRPFGQVVCAWTFSNDDPLRVYVSPDRKLVGSVEGPGGGKTSPVAFELKKWYKLTVVKQEGKWKLFLDGNRIGELRVPETMPTRSLAIALGGNPKLDSEALACRVANVRFYGKVLPVEQPGENK